jgi:hypothetical protein
MPQRFEKSAGVVAGGVEDMVNILRRASAAGKKLSDTPENLAKKILYEGHGSGSFIVDILKKPINKTGVGKKLNKTISRGQEKLVDLDMKAGKKVHDTLTKNPNNKAGQWLGNKFVQNHQIKLHPNRPGRPDEMLEVGAAGLTNPLAKAKDAVLPMAGAFAIGDQINKVKSKGGDTVKSAYSREELIQKIATVIDGKCINETIKKNENKDKENKDGELAKKAVELLKVAAQKIRQLEGSNEKLALENQRLYLEGVEKTRKEEATKLANEMNNKGLLKKADIQHKIDELSSMDDDSFSMFKDAVENLSLYNAEKDGVDSLTFVIDNNNINYRKTFADSINEAANEIK